MQRITQPLANMESTGDTVKTTITSTEPSFNDVCTQRNLRYEIGKKKYVLYDSSPKCWSNFLYIQWRQLQSWVTLTVLIILLPKHQHPLHDHYLHDCTCTLHWWTSEDENMWRLTDQHDDHCERTVCVSSLIDISLIEKTLKCRKDLLSFLFLYILSAFCIH